MNLDDEVVLGIMQHAARDYPREACGVVIDIKGVQHFLPCRNMAHGNDQFTLNPNDFADAQDLGDITAIYHSHPDTDSKPSMADKVSCELHGYPWVIVSHPGGGLHTFEPTGYVAPLLGREFFHGLLDCWTACRDYYKRELGIEFPNYAREDAWWETTDQSLYETLHEDAGFVRLPMDVELQRGDMLVMRVGRTRCANHAAIYLGTDPNLISEPSPAVGGLGPFFFHHMYGRNSERLIYGGNWVERTEFVLRPRGMV